MSTPTFETILVPVVTEEDARATGRALREYFDLDETDVTLTYVVEKASGAPDKASVEQREGIAEEVFEAARAELPDVEIETKLVYDTDVADGIRKAADEVGASAIVFVPRRGGRLARLLSGDVALSLVTESDLPVVSLPDEATDGRSGEEADQRADGEADERSDGETDVVADEPAGGEEGR